MRLIDERTAESYLRETGRVAADEPLRIGELPGGVSNMVLLIERPRHPAQRFVLKQARPQLRTAQAWHASVERNWREAEVLSVCAELLAARQSTPAVLLATTPAILFVDRENYLFAMTAAPEPNVTWKADLLAGRADAAIAAACGRLLGTLHGQSWQRRDIAAQLGDRALFDQLRIDPYYRALAAARPELAPALSRLIDSLAANCLALVHADFSPKNLLVFAGGLMMVDFETGHYGDPAFDLGFFLSHLLLKAFYHAPRHGPLLEVAGVFCRTYDETMSAAVSAAELAELWSRGMQNLAGCAAARLDGKSPVEYLSDETRRRQVRQLTGEMFADPPRDWPHVSARVGRLLAEG